MRFSIYRYNPDTDKDGYMQDYDIEIAPNTRMLLDAILQIKAVDDTLSLRKSCREGVCGSDAMNINGKNGLACMTPLDELKQPVVLRPLPGLPVIRDLIVDMTQFFAHYNSINPYLINNDPPPATERLQSPEDRAKLDGLYNASCAAPVRLPARPSGGTRINSSVQPACSRRIVSFPIAVTTLPKSAWKTWKIPTACTVATTS